jgi:riboflavin kinase/FMN adenylyltransferase
MIDSLLSAASRNQLPAGVLTFWPHPRKVLFPDQPSLRLLNSQQEKYRLLSSAGVDFVFEIPFSKDFSRLTSTEFVRDILFKKFNAKHLVLGYDHHFGRNREGTVANLKPLAEVYGFSIEEISPVVMNQLPVSSTKIRAFLDLGDVEHAAMLLGAPYQFSGLVVKGDQIGRKIGFPTANLKCSDPDKLMPANGVYAVDVFVNNKTYRGMMNIGQAPTLRDNNEVRAEVHIIDFSGDLYGSEINVNFLARIRSEKKFNHVDILAQQLVEDIEVARTCVPVS